MVCTPCQAAAKAAAARAGNNAIPNGWGSQQTNSISKDLRAQQQERRGKLEQARQAQAQARQAQVQQEKTIRLKQAQEKNFKIQQTQTQTQTSRNISRRRSILTRNK